MGRKRTLKYVRNRPEADYLICTAVQLTQDKMTNQNPSFRSSCFKFATTLLIVVISAFLAGIVAGSLGGSREASGVGAVGAVMAVLWAHEHRKTRNRNKTTNPHR